MFSIPVLVVVAVLLIVVYIIRENGRRPKNFPPGYLYQTRNCLNARCIVRSQPELYPSHISSTHFEVYKELREVARAAIRFLKCNDSTGSSISRAPWLRFIASDYFGWTSSITDDEIVFTFAKKVIKQRTETYIKDHPRDFIDKYLDEMNYLNNNGTVNSSFSETQMYTVSDFMFSAPVGIRHTINYLFAHLILEPSIQFKLQAELDRVVGRSRLPTLDDRNKLHYLEATLREVMRKDTLVSLSFSRRSVKDTTFAGYSIPKDTIILPNLWGMHNDPELWGDPENFRPERFLENDGTLMKKDLTLPFGAGKRLCPGETFGRHIIFIFVAGIMQNFTIRTPAGKPKPNFENLTNGITIITITMPAFWVEVVPRP